MPRDADFAAYLAARWPRLVRALVLLGGSPAEADAVARGALARLRPRWERTTEGEDPDVHAWSAVLEDWGARPWAGAPGPPGTERLAALEPALDRLRPDDRAALVLRAVGGLSDDQVARVLGRVPHAPDDAGDLADRPDEAAVRSAADEVDVEPAPGEGGLGPARRARRRTAPVVAVVALALVVAVATWLTTRTTEPPAPAADSSGPAHRVTRTDNAAGVVWWSVGTLHLPHADVAFPDVSQAVRVGDGAVVADDRGVVSSVSADGVVADVGHLDPGTPLIGSDTLGWAAWGDPTAPTPTLVVYDANANAVLAQLSLTFDAGHVRPVAFDRGLLFYVDARGNWQWEPGHDDPLRVLQPGLLDLKRATEARQLDARRVEVVQPFFNVVRVVAGEDAQLSPDASYLLTRLPGSGRRGRFGTVRVYDVRTGRPTWTGLQRQDVATAAVLGPRDEVHYLLVRASNLPHTYELRTCDLGTHRCRTVSRFNAPGAPPLLAR